MDASQSNATQGMHGCVEDDLTSYPPSATFVLNPAAPEIAYLSLCQNERA